MYIVSHADDTQEFETLASAQEWVAVLLRNRARFTVTYRY
jgi:hypothetical protein